jgi:hypothetical protein
MPKKLTADTFKTRSLLIHGGFYDYSKIIYTNARTKVTISCPLHGEFEQIPDHHLSGHGCKRCGGLKQGASKTHTTSDFVAAAELVHGTSYDYSYVLYRAAREPVSIICPMHGPFSQTPDNHLAGKGCMPCGLASGVATRLETMKKNGTNSGRYSPVFFAVNKHYENVYGLFYCVRLYNDNESFLKIGITKNEIRTRFGSATGRGNYLFEVVFTLRNYIVLLYQLEQGLLRLFNSWKYKPISEFGGDTECLRYECLPLITEACNQWEREYPCE